VERSVSSAGSGSLWRRRWRERADRCVVLVQAPEMKGIFASCPPVVEMETVKARLERGEPLDIASFSSPHIAAELLKSYLRGLPEPLIPYSLYDPMIALFEYLAGSEGTREALRRSLCCWCADCIY
jgi:hypothetical protein